MNRGNVLQSSPVQQMLSGSPNTWWSMMNTITTTPSQPPPPPQPHQYTPPPPPSSWHDHQYHHSNQELPDSLCQLLMSGIAGGGEDDKPSLNQVKKLETWEEQLLHDHHHHHYNSTLTNPMADSSIKQENSLNSGSSSSFCQGSNLEFLGLKQNNWSNSPMIPVSSPSSCITSLSNNNRNLLDFSTTISSSSKRHPPPDRTSECNSTATGGASKKAKIQSSSNQSTFKVRKEKLGDRITALHQLVSPFGKTDTASVLLEAIGYIRFLQSQIEALSLPYLGCGSGNLRNQQHSVQQGERNCLFPEDPGQLLNDSCLKMKGSALQQDSHEELKTDLRSRGLCLVPVSCTMQVGSDNGADYWTPSLNGGFR